jgi:hypothetical protein
MESLLLFVHGYSVTNLDTYGGLPARMQNESEKRDIKLSQMHIFLGRYISFNDELTLDDISRAFDLALREQLGEKKFARVIAITHSTGGPVLRNWMRLFCQVTDAPCPLTHLIMLAPPNNGSALAQLGKSKLSRMRAWLDAAEPGEKILDWLELGSLQTWNLNLEWISKGEQFLLQKQCWFFVLTGQDIDRKFYDHVNSYTGETGSDGVVRVASANLDSRYLRLKQSESGLEIEEFLEGPATPFRIISKRAHSNEEMGIMKSVRAELSDTASLETIDSIFDCINVEDNKDYKRLRIKFKNETIAVQQKSHLETENRGPFKKRYIHDRHAMIVFRVCDQEKNWLTDFDLVLTGPGNDPDLLPPGFLTDRQFNRAQGSLTYYFNYDLVIGCNAVVDENGNEVRPKMEGIQELGLYVKTRPEQGMVHYKLAMLHSSSDFLQKALQPNSTTLMEIMVTRLVNKEVFRFQDVPEGSIDVDFKGTKPGTDYLGP